MEHIKQMDYLSRCIQESLRLFPTIPFFGRLINEEVELSKSSFKTGNAFSQIRNFLITKLMFFLGNYRIPPGSEVIVSVFDVHRDPLYWPDPTKYDPDRFLPENTKNQHPFAYLPFSGGIRSCIGKNKKI